MNYSRRSVNINNKWKRPYSATIANDQANTIINAKNRASRGYWQNMQNLSRELDNAGKNLGVEKV